MHMVDHMTVLYRLLCTCDKTLVKLLLDHGAVWEGDASSGYMAGLFGAS